MPAMACSQATTLDSSTPGKVYITKFNINMKADKISFQVQECDSCNQVSGSKLSWGGKFPIR